MDILIALGYLTAGALIGVCGMCLMIVAGDRMKDKDQ